MNFFLQRRAWFWIATVAIVLALIALLVTHGSDNGQPDLWTLLPLLFLGLIVPFVLAPLASSLELGHSSDAPALAPLFQRPPPACI
ncbi:MAG: hypothetical protein JST28_01025 [Acidobacteria bacterium]|nr:hypothetical protein [Acidobacteriota bacterium]